MMQAGEQRTMLNIAPRKKRIVSGLTSLSFMISSTTRRTSREFTLMTTSLSSSNEHRDDAWNGGADVSERTRDGIICAKHTHTMAKASSPPPPRRFSRTGRGDDEMTTPTRKKAKMEPPSLPDGDKTPRRMDGRTGGKEGRKEGRKKTHLFDGSDRHTLIVPDESVTSTSHNFFFPSSTSTGRL